MKANEVLLTLLLSTLLAAGSLAQRMPLVYDVENTGADCPAPAFPSISELPTIDPLPDPFLWGDSSGRISKYSEWRLRRAEISALVQHYLLGNKPAPPDTLQASFANDTLTVSVVVGGKSLSLHARITLPGMGSGPFPAVIGMGFGTGSLPSDIFASRNIATIAYNFGELAAWGAPRGQGGFYTLYPDPKVGNFTAWAWGISRIIDGLSMLPQTNIDLKHLAVTGCSFAGKMALYAGALDERIALTIAQEPGGGGDATWRFSQLIGPTVETLANAQGYAWYYEDVKQFNNAVTKLPFDQHEVMALIAPRALFVLGNPDYVWLSDESGYVGCMAAQLVWVGMRANDRFGFSKIGGHEHCQLPDVQRPQVIAFVQKFLLGDTTANTFISDSPWSTNLSGWITWPFVRLTNDLTSAGNAEKVIDRFDLEQNYPNPFNPSSTIRYSVPHRSYVTLTLYDVLGQQVAQLVNEEEEAGHHDVKIGAAGLSSGVYFYRMQARLIGGEAGGYAETKRLLLLK